MRTHTPECIPRLQLLGIDYRERGALKRLAVIMAKYPTLTPYVQGDPRGASLYILHHDDILPGCAIDSCYSRGTAVYK